MSISTISKVMKSRSSKLSSRRLEVKKKQKQFFSLREIVHRINVYMIFFTSNTLKQSTLFLLAVSKISSEQVFVGLFVKSREYFKFQVHFISLRILNLIYFCQLLSFLEKSLHYSLRKLMNSLVFCSLFRHFKLCFQRMFYQSVISFLQLLSIWILRLSMKLTALLTQIVLSGNSLDQDLLLQKLQISRMSTGIPQIASETQTQRPCCDTLLLIC